MICCDFYDLGAHLTNFSRRIQWNQPYLYLNTSTVWDFLLFSRKTIWCFGDVFVIFYIFDDFYDFYDFSAHLTNCSRRIQWNQPYLYLNTSTFWDFLLVSRDVLWNHTVFDYLLVFFMDFMYFYSNLVSIEFVLKVQYEQPRF